MDYITVTNLVREEAIVKDIEGLYHIGRSPSGGFTRLAFTDDETNVIEFLTKQFPKAEVVHDVRYFIIEQ